MRTHCLRWLLLHRYNVTLLAYGQAGSGKTESMFGENRLDGLVPTVLRELVLCAHHKRMREPHMELKIEVIRNFCFLEHISRVQ